MTDESKYCTTYCKRCQRLIEVRTKCIHGRKTVLCKIAGDHNPPRVMYYHGCNPRNKIHEPETKCPYYLPKSTTSYKQLALESKRITELKENS